MSQNEVHQIDISAIINQLGERVGILEREKQSRDSDILNLLLRLDAIISGGLEERTVLMNEVVDLRNKVTGLAQLASSERLEKEQLIAESEVRARAVTKRPTNQKKESQ